MNREDLELIHASIQGDVNHIKSLLKMGCNINSKNAHTALMWATIYGQTEAVKVLMRAKPNLDEKGELKRTVT